jgi:arylmalonate decarboxylase
MRNNITIGLVVPHSADTVPSEGPQMYPGVKFISRGVGVKKLTPEGFNSAFEAIVPTATELSKQNIEAIMVIGTSLTFYRGFQAHEQLLEKLRTLGLPVSTMSRAIVDGLRALGARRIAVCTAYTDLINERLRGFLTDSGFEVLEMEGFGLDGFEAPQAKSEEDIFALAGRVCAKAKGAEALLISCGGLRTLDVGRTIEEKYGLPVVSSMPASFWAALRLVGESGAVPGYGRLLEQTRH